MQTDQYKQIDALLERFFDGGTSNAEEQELYAFFARPDVPEYLQPYKPVFGYFETGLAQEVGAKHAANKPRRLLPRGKRVWWIAVCAAVAALLFFLNQPGNRRPDTFDPYEGSYIVRNGVKITDRDVVKPALERSIHRMELQREQVEQLTCRINEQSAQFSEKEQQAHSKHQAILDNIPNEQVRREVQEILAFE